MRVIMINRSRLVNFGRFSGFDQPLPRAFLCPTDPGPFFANSQSSENIVTVVCLAIYFCELARTEKVKIRLKSKI